MKAGQKGIRILAPVVGVRRNKRRGREGHHEQNERIVLGFRNACVFDVSQTDGAALSKLHEVNGDPGETVARLAAFLRFKSIQLVYNVNIAPALGMSYGGRIAILPGRSKAEEFSTLVRETAHELLHKAERRTATTKTVREIEAEAVAFVVGKAVGLVTGSASADYIQLYHGNASMLAESLEVVQQTASVILGALEPTTEGEATAGSGRLDCRLIYGSGLQPSGSLRSFNLGLRPRLVWDGPSALSATNRRQTCNDNTVDTVKPMLRNNEDVFFSLSLRRWIIP